HRRSGGGQVLQRRSCGHWRRTEVLKSEAVEVLERLLPSQTADVLAHFARFDPPWRKWMPPYRVTDELVRTTRSTESFSQYAVRMYARAFAVALSLVTLGCDEPNGSAPPPPPPRSPTAKPPHVFV